MSSWYTCAGRKYKCWRSSHCTGYIRSVSEPYECCDVGDTGCSYSIGYKCTKCNTAKCGKFHDDINLLFCENFITHFGFSQQTLQEENASRNLIVHIFSGPQSMLQSAAISTRDVPSALINLIGSAISAIFQAVIFDRSGHVKKLSWTWCIHNLQPWSIACLCDNINHCYKTNCGACIYRGFQVG